MPTKATLPKAVADAMATAAEAVRRVAAAREAVEAGRLDRPTLAVELTVYGEEIRRLEELAKPRPRVNPSPAVLAALERRRAGMAELQKVADADRGRCCEIEQSAAAARDAHEALLAAVASNISELVKLGGVDAAVDRLLLRIRESVAARLLSLGYEDVALTSDAVWLEAHAAEDWGDLGAIRHAVNQVRHAAAAGDAPPWPGAVRDVVASRIVEEWKQEDRAAAAPRGSGDGPGSLVLGAAVAGA